MKVNDFVINIATVNGSGSQSANNVLLRSLFRMGVPVGGKNIFPSNIAGLPTWFWIRANPQGFVGRKPLADIVVTLNPQTFKEDLKTLASGGFYFYPSTFVIPEELKRPDITCVPVPFKQLTDESTDIGKIKKLVTNMVYVGLLAEILKIDSSILDQVLRDQLGKKASVLEVNQKAVAIGAKYARDNFAQLNFSFKAEKKDLPKDKIIIDGNSAAALGLVQGGCTFASWYPITPSTSMMEGFIKFADKLRKDESGKNKYAVVQAEDELAAFTMVLGAGWAGARAITATSGPGMSLMAEAAGYAYYAEVPSVLWNVQRVGPSTGLPTRTLQGDLMSAAQLSHGDKKHPILLPGTVQECFEFGQTCFDLAEGLQQLVIVMSDLDLGMNMWSSDSFDLTPRPYNRGKVLSAEALEKVTTFERYRDIDGDGIPYRTLPGNKHPKAPFFTRGSGHNAKAQYTENADEHFENMQRLSLKWETAKKMVPAPIVKGSGNKVGLVYYGSTEAVMEETLFELTQKGQKVDTLRIRAIPFGAQVEEFLKNHETIYVVEQNRDAQMKSLLVMEFPQFAAKLKSMVHFDGTPITADLITHKLLTSERSH